MMRARRIPKVLSLIAGFALLGGCGSNASLSRFVPPEEDAFARAYFDSVRTGRIDYAIDALEPEFSSRAGTRDDVVRLAADLPSGPLDSVHLVGVNRFQSSQVDRSNLTYEFHSAKGWGVVAIAVDAGPTTPLIYGIHSYHLTQSLERANAFTFRGKGAGHYLMLVLVLVCFGSAVWVALLALRTSMKRRWAWALLAIVGAGTVIFNWTTGQVGFQLLSLLFFDAASGRAGPAAPWVLEAAFPIGAVMTWRRIQQARNSVLAPNVSAAHALSPVPSPLQGVGTVVEQPQASASDGPLSE